MGNLLLVATPTDLSGEHGEGHVAVHALCDVLAVQPHAQGYLLLLQVIRMLPQGHLLPAHKHDGEGEERGGEGRGRGRGGGRGGGKGRGGRGRGRGGRRGNVTCRTSTAQL